MNEALKTIIRIMLNKRCIGAKHTPEEKLINSKTKWLEKYHYKDFENEYQELINNKFILRTKNRKRI